MIKKVSSTQRRIVYAVIMLMVLFIFGCNKKVALVSVTTKNNLSPKKTIALGDSYTIGEAISEEDRFINKAITLVKATGININYPSQIVAQTGWNTRNLLDALSARANSFTPPYDIVTLQIGVNNQFQLLDTAAYRIEFTECLQKALLLSGNKKDRIFVLSIPDYGATPFGHNNASVIKFEINQFNAINKQVSFQKGVNYIDITPSSRLAAKDLSLVAEDGLHPSGKEYLKWAKMLTPKMLELLR